jgi:putative nucleotidyltransferase with HDIG domain
MNILDKLGLGQKYHPDAPLMGKEKKKKEEASTLRKNIYLRGVIIAVFLAIVCYCIPRHFSNPTSNYKIGTPWKKKNLTAPFSFDIQKSKQQIEREKKKASQNTPPIFIHHSQALNRVENSLDSLFYRIYPVMAAYKNWQKTKKAQDSLALQQKKAHAGVGFTSGMWSGLFKKSNLGAVPSNFSGTPSQKELKAVGPNLYENLKKLLGNVLNNGVVNKPVGTLKHNRITVRNMQKHLEQTFGIANIRDIQGADHFAHNQLFQRYNDGVAGAGLSLFKQVITPNFFYNAQQTNKRVQKAVANVSETEGAITKGQVIIRKGDLITPQKYRELKSLAKARTQYAGHAGQWKKYAGGIIAVFAVLVIFFLYLFLYRKQIFTDNLNLLLVLLTFSIIIVASSLLFRFTNIPLYIIPVAIAPIILTIIFDSRVGILSALTLAFITGFINSANFEFTMATIVGCSLGLFSVRDIKNRSQFFFTTPVIVFVSYIVVIIGFSLAVASGWTPFLTNLAYVVINALFIVFTYPLILLYEKVFNITTDLTLIELSDSNLPLLKLLMNKAAGTFHHSLQVANLAEAAAGNIGANALLCRAGALYHDIGKLENPEYFTENQLGGNEHDNLKPRMSALVIKAHVSNGVKIAKEHKLPDMIIDFIKTHHGTSVIKYFYEKAKEQSDPEKNEIKEEDFRYDGPRPYSKETGIVMLADGVEAASRAMKNPNYQKLKQLIDKLVDARLNEGQLSQTPLTFRDLSIIKRTFLNILVGVYHSRVEYPEEKEDKESKEVKAEKPQKKEGEQQVKDGKKKPSARKKQKNGKRKKPVDDYYNS